MNSCADGGSSRVSIPHHLRKTLQSIREITGKQHSDEDIFSVYKESFNDPHETAQKLLFLDTFHEVRSKRNKKKENLVPIAQGNGRSGRRNFASTNTYHGNGKSESFKRESGANHVTGGSRNLTVPRAIKVSGPTCLPSEVSNHKVQDGLTTTMNKELAEENPLSMSAGVELETSKEISGSVAAPVPVSVIQNHTQDVTSQISQPVVNSQPAEFQASIFVQQNPSVISSSHCSSQPDQVTENETASKKGKVQSLLKSDVGERSHVIFPFHLQVAEAQQNGLTFGSFDSNFVKEASSNSDASGCDGSSFEPCHGTGDDEGNSSPTRNCIPVVASDREGSSSCFEDNDHGILNSSPGAELVRHSYHIAPPVDDELKEEALSNTQTHQIAYGQQSPLSAFGLTPSLSALGQPLNTKAAETEPGYSNAPALSLLSYPPDQCSIAAAASQQANHLFRQQYPPNFFPYGPYYPPFYMAPPYIHQFLIANGIPSQSYFPPGTALVAPTCITPVSDTENPPTTKQSSYASSTVATNIPSATALNSIHSEEKTSPLTENGAAWIEQGLGNLQVSSMYNVALQGQPLGFPSVQAGHGGVMGVYQPTQPMAAASTTYQTLLPPPHTTTAMAEPIGQPHISYQQPQVSLTNWVNNY